MKKKTFTILYIFSMVLLIPLVIDLFINSQQYGSGFIILFLMASATWGIVKLRKDKKE